MQGRANATGSATAGSGRSGSSYLRENGFAIGIVGILMIFFIPIPPAVVDFGIAISIALSVMILMLALWIGRPLEFSSFPTILLVATLLRLALNVATTRLILADGAHGVGAAGNIIGGVASIVMGGDFIIGLIVFLILVTINFIVITKGATRIAEVGARFTLDGIPGKQMAIDADLSAGIINEKQAQKRRRELEEETAFFGAMDGASKFVRGDAIAGIIILAVNIVGGGLIGVIRHGMPLSSAADVFIKLSIGDGLVAQIPALIVSLAAGLLVSKGGGQLSADKAIAQQFSGYPQAITIASVLMVVLGLTPGLPFMPFAVLGSTMYFLARTASRVNELPDETVRAAKAKSEEKGGERDLLEDFQLPQLEIAMGRQVSLLVYSSHDELAFRMAKLRKNFIHEFGFLIPDIRLAEDLDLESKQYSIRVHGSAVGSYAIRPGELLIVLGQGANPTYPGEVTKEPAFGMDAMWVPQQLRSEMERQGYRPVDPVSVILTHLSETIRNNLSQLLSYRSFRMLLDRMQLEYRKLVEDIVPSHTSLAAIHGILKALLDERISIRNLDLILEAIAEVTPQITRSDLLVEHVRSRLAAQISSGLAQKGTVNIVGLSKEWETDLAQSMRRNERGEVFEFDIRPATIEEFRNAVEGTFAELARKEIQAVLVVSSELRPYVRLIAERALPAIAVLSHLEIAKGIPAKVVATVQK